MKLYTSTKPRISYRVKAFVSFLTIAFFVFLVPNKLLAQNNCAAPTEITFPYAASNVSTAGTAIDFTGSCTVAGNNGEDYYYHFTLATQQCIKYEVKNFSAGAAVYLVSGCPSAAGTCISAHSCRMPYCNGVLEEYTLAAGSYYIVVKGDAAATPVTFSIAITSLAPDNNVACASCDDQDNCVSCKNSGFEKMSLQNWNGRTGVYANPGQTAGFVTGPLNNGLTRHTIVTRGHFDSLITTLPVVPPDGGDYAVRLGNNNNGRQAEQLSYTIIIDSTNTNFIYKYAVVFEDPAHAVNEQPFFSISLNVNGQNIACAEYEVRPRPGLEGFKNGGLSPGNPGTAPGSQVSNNKEPMYYKEWTTVNIPLIDYIGQTATITFTTKDCSLGAHFGYAYIDAHCERIDILPKGNTIYCDKDTVTLTAPNGFVSYRWNTGQQSQIIRVTKKGTYTVTATTVTGCVISLSTFIDINTPPIPKFTASFDCSALNYQFTDQSIPQDNSPIARWVWSFGDGDSSFVQNPVHKYATSGNYQVKLRLFTDKGCFSDTVISYAVVVAPKLGVAITGAKLICNNTSTRLTATPIGGKAPYTYLWNNGSTATNITVGAGKYWVRINDASGYSCFASDTFALAQMPPISVNVIEDSVFACAADEFRTVVAIGSSNVVSYLWSNGDGSNSVQLNKGKYYVTAFDSLGCAVTDSVVVVAPTTLLSVDITSPEPVCKSTLGEIVSQGVGGYGGYLYKWDTGDSVKNIFKPKGLYCATVTDLHGCKALKCGLINELDTLVATITGTSLICNGAKTSLQVNATGGKAPYTYKWNTGETTATLANKGGGSYTVIVTDNSSYSCKASVSFTITEAPALAVQVPMDTLYACDSLSTISVTALGGTGTYRYEWSNGDAGPTVQVKAGKYSVTIIDSLACKASDTLLVVTPSDSLQALVNKPAPVCNGTNGTLIGQGLNGYGNYTYKWSTGETSKNITKPAGTYCLVVSDLRGCSEQICGVVVESPIMQASIQAPKLICSGAKAAVTTTVAGGIPPYTYLWSTAETTSALNNKVAGTYTVTVRDASAIACSVTATVTITEAAALSVKVPLDTLFACDSLSIVTVTAKGGTGSYRFEWSNGDAGATVQLKAGKYSVTVIDSLGCRASDSIVITVPANALSAFVQNPAPVCFGTEGVLVAQGAAGYGSYTYQWSSGESTKSLSKAVGTYCVTVSDGKGCKASACGVVTELNKLIVQITGFGSLCFGDSVDLTARVTGGTAPYNYLWSTGASTAKIDKQAPGFYSVQVSDNSAIKCTAQTTTLVNESPQIVTSFASTNVTCNGLANGKATATVTGGVQPYTYFWESSPSTIGASLVNLGPGKHYVRITDKLGCIKRDSLLISEPLPLVMNVKSLKNVSCSGEADGNATVLLTGGTPTYTFSWSPSGGNTETAINLAAGIYTVNASDKNGCTISKLITINQPVPLSVSLQSTNLSCFESNDGKITGKVAGGIQPYNYVWFPNVSSTDSASDLFIGTYELKVSDVNNCIVTAKATLTQPELITLKLTALSANCEQGNGKAIVKVLSGGIPPFMFKWGANAANQQNDTAYNLVEGQYTVEVVDSKACLAKGTVLVGDIAAGVATLTEFFDPTCAYTNNGSLTVSVSGNGKAPYTYQWYNAVTNAPLVGQTKVRAQGLAGGRYYVLVTDVNNCVMRSDEGLLKTPEPMEVTIKPTNVKCFDACDGSAKATVTGGVEPYAYRWNDFSIQTTQTAFSLCNEEYQVIAKDANGCADTAKVTLTQPSPINLDSSVVNTNCNDITGEACVLISGGVGPYQTIWPQGQTAQCVNGLKADTYVVKVTDFNQCEVSLPITVGNFNAPDIELRAKNEPACFGDCDGSITVGLKGDSAFFSVEWSANAKNQNTVTASALCADVYIVKFTTDKGCVSSMAIPLVQPEEIELGVNIIQPLCNNSCDGGISLNVKGGTAPYKFIWKNENSTQISTDKDIIGLCPGNYTLLITDSLNCTKMLQVTLDNPAPLAAKFVAKDVSCNSFCDGSAELIPVNGVSPYTYQWDAAANAQITRTALDLCAGTYTAQVVDRNGCKASNSVIINQPDSLIAYPDVQRNVSCNGLCDGSATVRVVGGTGTYKYSWTNGVSSTAVADTLCEGSYAVTVSDKNLCKSSLSFTITQPEVLLVKVITNPSPCPNECLANANAQIKGGTLPYSIQWDTPSAEQSNYVDSLCVGTYNVQIKDANKCITSQQILVTNPTGMLLTQNLVNPNCGQENGEICVTTVGGQAPYKYVWSDDRQQQTSCADSLRAGCYELFVTDNNGCAVQKIICLDNVSGPLVSEENHKNVSCANGADGIVSFSVSGGEGQISTILYDKNNKVIATNTLFMNKLEAGCYTLAAIDGAGCRTSKTVCISEPSPVTAYSIKALAVGCKSSCNGEAEVAVYGGVKPYSYNWSGGNTPTLAATNGLCAGVFEVLVRDSFACETKVFVTIDSPEELIIDSVKTRNTSCFDNCDGRADAFVSGGSAPFSYTWSNGSANAPNATNLCGGNYTLFVIDRNACVTNTSFVVNQPSRLSVNMAIENPSCGLCNGTSTAMPLGGTAPYTYNWNEAGDAPRSATTASLCTGTYSVTVSDKNKCTAQGSVELIGVGKPIIDSVSVTAPTCNNFTNGLATVYARGGVGKLSYQWDANAKLQTSQTAFALTNGSYCVEVNDASGCKVKDCFAITNPTPIYLVNSESKAICKGEKVQLYAAASGGNQGYTISWNDTTLKGFGPHNVSPVQNTSYCYFVLDANGCKSADTCIDINLIPKPELVLLSPNEICQGDTVIISARAFGGKTNYYNWSWKNNTGSSVPANNNYDRSAITVMPDTTGYYKVVVSDACGQPVQDSIRVIVNSLPTIDLSGVTRAGCAPFTTQLNLPNSSGNFYAIDFECDGSTDYYGSDQSVSYTYADSGVYTICIEATTLKGCKVKSRLNNFISVYPSPVAKFVFSPGILDPLDPRVDITDLSVGAKYMMWDFGDGFQLSGKPDSVLGVSNRAKGVMTRLNYTYLDDGFKTLWLKVTNAYGCVDVVSSSLKIEPVFEVFVPNAFTPDGDGFNDEFVPNGVGFKPEDFTMSIFDRWGEQIFTTNNLNQRWDGTIKGNIVKNDVYVWVVQVIDFTGHKHNYKGHVTVFK